MKRYCDSWWVHVCEQSELTTLPTPTMKYLTLIALFVAPLIALSAPELQWQWTGNPDQPDSEYNLVRTKAPTGVESSDFSILVTYTWDLHDVCDSSSKADTLVQIEIWDSKLQEALAASDLGFSLATRVHSDCVEKYFYVSDLNAFRTLSYKSGELEIGAEVDYRFSRDLDWQVWQSLRDEIPSTLYLALLEEE